MPPPRSPRSASRIAFCQIAPAVRSRPGDVVHVGRAASVQFAGAGAFNFRVIRVHDWFTDVGWCWLDGYQLDAKGEATQRRTIYVQPAGLAPAR